MLSNITQHGLNCLNMSVKAYVVSRIPLVIRLQISPFLHFGGHFWGDLGNPFSPAGRKFEIGISQMSSSLSSSFMHNFMRPRNISTLQSPFSVLKIMFNHLKHNFKTICLKWWFSDHSKYRPTYCGFMFSHFQRLWHYTWEKIRELFREKSEP